MKNKIHCIQVLHELETAKQKKTQHNSVIAIFHSISKRRQPTMFCEIQVRLLFVYLQVLADSIEMMKVDTIIKWIERNSLSFICHDPSSALLVQQKVKNNELPLQFFLILERYSVVLQMKTHKIQTKKYGICQFRSLITSKRMYNFYTYG